MTRVTVPPTPPAHCAAEGGRAVSEEARGAVPRNTLSCIFLPGRMRINMKDVSGDFEWGPENEVNLALNANKRKY